MTSWLIAGRVWRRINIGLIIFAAVGLLSAYLPDWWMALREKFSIEYEGHVLWACRQLACGDNIYDARYLVSPPWAVIIYNPLYLLAGALLMKVLGLAFWPLRLLSMLSAVACAVALFSLLRRGGCTRSNSVIGCLFFAGFLPVAYWSCLARVDFLGLALAAWGVERFVANLKDARPANGKLQGLGPSLVLLVLAFFTKQQYFVFTLGLAVYLLFTGQRRLAGRFALTFAAAVVAVGLCLQLVTQGYLAHLSFAAGLPWEWDTLEYHLRLLANDPKTILGLALVLLTMFMNKGLESSKYVPLFILCISLPLLLWTMGLRGAYHNHMLSTIFAFSWWTALCLRRLRPYFSAITLIVVLCSLSQVHKVTQKLKGVTAGNRFSRDWVEILKAPRFRQAMILAEDPSMAMFASDRPAIIDVTTFMNVWAGRPGAIDPLLEAIGSRQYAAVIMNRSDSRDYYCAIWPSKVVSLVKRNYRLCGWVKGNGNDQDLFVRPDTMGLKH